MTNADTSQLTNSYAADALCAAAWDIVMDGATAAEAARENDTTVNIPHALGSLAMQLYSAGAMMLTATAAGMRCAQLGGCAVDNPFLVHNARKTHDGAAALAQSNKVEYAYLAKFWQDGFAAQRGEDQALNATTNQDDEAQA